MKIVELIQPGDKVDMTILQKSADKRTTGNLRKTYKSEVLDITEDGNIAVTMPSKAGKLILLPLGIRLAILFYTKKGLYRAVGLIKERYKSDNMHMLKIELKTQVEKFQRREYFRFPYLLDFSYYTITEEEANSATGKALWLRLCEREVNSKGTKREHTGSIVDLSGGGIRFCTKTELESDQWLLLEIHLKNEVLDKHYYIIGSVIQCSQTEKNGTDQLFEVRAKFHIEDDKIREEIIQFIFEEERRSRQRGRY